ncbi:MAG: hypothetical protein IKR33_07200 [Bacteroidales bacterium]|nr:hypothetical protein [Bacteroidales bacterium]
MGATNCPETPRQKMITMMYLVYTAMLALNVSAQVVDGFKTVGSAMTKSNENLQVKLDDTYANFQAALDNSKDKVQADYDKAQEVRRLSAELGNYIDSLQYVLMAKISPTAEIHPDLNNPKYSYKMSVVNPDKSPNFDSIKKAIDIAGFRWLKMDELHESTNLFSSENGKGGKGIELKNKIIEYKRKVKNILGEDSSSVNIALNVEGKVLDPDNNPQDWEVVNFYEVVSGSSLVTLTRLKAETMNAEFDAVNTLYKHVNKGDFKFDQVRMISRPKSSYIIQGGVYETDINVAAYDSHQEFTAKVNGQELHSNDSGSVHYRAVCNTVGVQKVIGTAYVSNPDGGVKEYPISDNYFVGKPVAVVSLDKMQVVYTGIDNPMTISVPGVEGRNINATIDGGGSFQKVEGDGAFILKPNGSTKKIVIKVEAKIDNKMQPMGTQEVRVKPIPTPIIKLGGYKTGDKVSKKQITEGARIIASRPEGFDFELPKGAMRVDQIEVYISNKPFTTKGDRLTSEMYSAIRKAQKGDMINVDATVIMPDGKPTHAYCSIQLKN